jgi:hypothetical protein
MPIPGPRTQHGPVPGYDNPGHELLDRFNNWGRPAPVADMGQTPGLSYITLRGCVLGDGQVRRMWRQSIGYIAAAAPYSWTSNSPRTGVPNQSEAPFQITRTLRYMTRSLYAEAGLDNTRFAGLHTRIIPQVRSMPVTLGAGTVKNRPTVRNRMSSFGSRVPALNQAVTADTSASGG